MATPRRLTQVASLETICRSIAFDPQVERWFEFLILQPAVRNDLLTTSSSFAPCYRRLSQMNVLFLGIIFSLGITVPLAIQKPHLFLLGIMIPLFVLLHFVTQAKKKNLIVLCRELLTKSFSAEELKQKTLYQTSEILGARYHVPSIVDKIYHEDYLLRIFFFIWVITGIMILYLPFWTFFGIIYLEILAFQTIIRLNPIYRLWR
jgi:hypothetical protein